MCRISPEAYPDKSYEGRVAEIAPEANRQKGTLQVKVQVREPDRFMTPELSAKVEFLAKVMLWHAALIHPATAAVAASRPCRRYAKKFRSIDGDDFASLGLFHSCRLASIGEIHRLIGVFLHQFGQTRRWA